jgi:hypothetical protein
MTQTQPWGCYVYSVLRQHVAGATDRSPSTGEHVWWPAMSIHDLDFCNTSFFLLRNEQSWTGCGGDADSRPHPGTFKSKVE